MTKTKRKPEYKSVNCPECGNIIRRRRPHAELTFADGTKLRKHLGCQRIFLEMLTHLYVHQGKEWAIPEPRHGDLLKAAQLELQVRGEKPNYWPASTPVTIEGLRAYSEMIELQNLHGCRELGAIPIFV